MFSEYSNATNYIQVFASPLTPTNFAGSTPYKSIIWWYIPLSWTASTGATGYKIYSSHNGGAYSLSTTTSATSLNLNIGSSISGTYDFKVSAYNTSGESDLSSAVEKTFLPPASASLNSMTNYRGVYAYECAAVCGWTVPDNTTQIKIYQYDAPGLPSGWYYDSRLHYSYATYPEGGDLVVSYEGGAVKKFAIVASNEFGNSAMSGLIDLTPPPPPPYVYPVVSISASHIVQGGQGYNVFSLSVDKGIIATGNATPSYFLRSPGNNGLIQQGGTTLPDYYTHIAIQCYVTWTDPYYGYQYSNISTEWGS